MQTYALQIQFWVRLVIKHVATEMADKLKFLKGLWGVVELQQRKKHNTVRQKR
jgi:hypothetical protein